MKIRFWSLTILLLTLCAAITAFAQEMQFQLDPAQSKVEFTLDATLHGVHGSFDLRPSTIYFNPQAGTASGDFVVDATSGNSGNKGRDKKMHKEILESAKFPEIRFSVQKFHGILAANGTSQIELVGVMTLHGSDHPMTVTAPIKIENGRASADIPFEVPYVQWGVKNPSTFLLRVSDKVTIVVHATGAISVTTTNPK